MNVHRSFPKSLICICLLALYAALALCQKPENELDSAKSGNYLILYCNANTTGSYAAYLQVLIPYMQSSLEAVLRDLDRGTASPAFHAFFKTNNNLETVRQVFTDIINGPDVLTVDTMRNDTRWAPPSLVCADADEPFLDHLLDECNSFTRPIAYIFQPARIVSICPLFWTVPRIARKRACPLVANGKLLTEPWNLRTTQYAILVHEMVHVYNRFDDSRQEVYDLEDVVGLDAIRSVENAQNYASYAAAIQAGCTEFPAPPASGGDGDICRGRCLGVLNNTLDTAKQPSNSTAAGGELSYTR